MTCAQARTPTVLATNPNADLYGASRMFLESVAGMRERGWRVVICTAEQSGPLLEATRARGCEERSVPSPVLRKTYLTPIGLLRLLWLTLRSVPADIRVLREVRPDILYANTIIQPLWLLLGRCLGIRVVCHVHEGEASAPRAVRMALSYPLVLAHRLILNSRFSMKVLLEVLPRVEDRCAVVVNGVAAPPRIEAPRPAIANGARLLYVGRLSERKGTGDAIEAVRLLRDRGVAAELDIVGNIYPGNEAFEAGLRDAVRRADLSDRVRFRGFQPDVWPWLAACDVLLVPSRSDEPFGNTAVEGTLAARPVVATGVGGLGEATEGSASVVQVAPSAPEEIADAVDRIVAEWSTFREQARADSVAVAQRHAPSTYQATIVAVLSAGIPEGIQASGTDGEPLER